MSRSGYTDDYGEDDPLGFGRYRAAVQSALRGKRGQAFLREAIAALDALPEKKLITNSFEQGKGSGEFCTLGAVGRARNLNMPEIEEDEDIGFEAARLFDIAQSMAREIMYENDECGRYDQTPEQRFIRMRRWLERQLIEWDDKP